MPGAAARNPIEYSEFTSAMSLRSPQAQSAALERFLAKYPQSQLAPQARKWLAMNRSRQQGLPVATAIGPRRMIPPITATQTAVPTAAPTPAPAVAPIASVPAAPAPQPHHNAASEKAKPGVIELQAQTLTIRADNSSLSQILKQVSAESGMKVEGLTHDQRIYGNFGPGKPQEVLSSLMDGLGYNVLMLGQSERGVPLQLVLSARGAGGVGPTAPTQPGNQEEDTVAEEPPPEPPPVRNFGANNMDPQQNGRPTQQMLDELRRMHQQQGGEQPVPPPQ